MPTDIEKETGISNAKRAKWAEVALAALPKGKKDEEDIFSNIVDLSADLLHLAEKEGFSAAKLHLAAWGRYQYESALGGKEGE